jgi:O-antigen ligase
MTKAKIQTPDARTTLFRQVAFYALAGTISVGSIALKEGTRSLTDVKEPIFVAGTLIVVAILACEFAIRRSIWLPEGLGRFALAIGVYMAYLTASVSWASHTWIVKYIVAEHTLHFLIAIAAAVVLSEITRWRSFLAMYVALGAAISITSLHMHTFMPYFHQYPGTRFDAVANFFHHGFYAANANGEYVRLHTLNDVHAPLGNANLLSAFLLLVMGLSMAFLWREWKGTKRGWVFASVAVTCALALTVFGLCRSVSYSIGLGALVTVFVSLRSRLWYVFIPLSIMGAIAAFIVLMHVPVPVDSKTMNAVEYFQHTKSYLVRAELWRRAWVMTGEKPILGWGAGNYFTDSAPVSAQVAKTMVTYYEGGGTHTEPAPKVLAQADSNAHNEYLHQTAEGGIVGLCIYLSILAVAAKAAFDARKRGFPEEILLDGVISVFAAFLVTNLMNPEVHFADFARHFWMVVALLVAARGIQGGRKAHAPDVVKGMAAVVVLVACICGAYEFVYQDYRGARDWWAAFRLRGEERPAEAAEWYMQSAGRTWDKVLRIRGLFGAGESYSASGQYDKAIAAFGELSDEVISLADTDYLLGRLYEGRRDYTNALKHYKIAADGHPEDERAAARILAIETFSRLKQQGRLPGGLGPAPPERPSEQ